jgi:tripartite-type tricarboxylate transporter receptor subunit TctC
MRHVHCRWLAAAAISLVAFVPAQAQYPNKPIRLILPFPPGGAVDTLGRIIGPRLSEALGQQVVLENRPGATGNIGAELVAKSPPDGYTVLMGAIPLSISVSVYSKLGFDPVKDLAPVSLLASTPNVVVVHPSVPAKSVKELIALARARPSQLDFSSSGAGGSPHLAGALFNNLAGTRMNHIPYKGGGPAVIALVAGEVSVGFATAPSVIHHVKSGRLRGLAVTSAQRAPLAPDLPTVSEAGIPGYEAGAWQGLLVPTGTRREIISRLHAESSKVLKLPEVKERLDATGLTPIGSTPEEFAAYLRSEIEKWGKVVRSVGMRVD